jgi:hypothetical protein
MKQLAQVLAMVSGCSLAQGAMSALTGTKPVQVTVVNNMPAPRVATPVAHDDDRVATAVGAGVAGAVVGGVAGALLGGDARGIAGGALVGAGVGTAVGLVVHSVAD